MIGYLGHEAELHDWEVRASPVEIAYYGGAIARGRIYNDSKSRFPDGKLITTSIIQELKNGYCLTNNTLYKLVNKDG